MSCLYFLLALDGDQDASPVSVTAFIARLIAQAVLHLEFSSDRLTSRGNVCVGTHHLKYSTALRCQMTHEVVGIMDDLPVSPYVLMAHFDGVYHHAGAAYEFEDPITRDGRVVVFAIGQHDNHRSAWMHRILHRQPLLQNGL